MATIAIVQQAPVLLDRDATLRAAINYLEEAKVAGAELVVFPEAYISGYPSWIWRLRPGGDFSQSERLHGLMMESAIDITAGELQPLCDTAQRLELSVVCGINERDGEFSRSTLFNSVVTVSHEGHIVNRHRKLMPTNPERMVWGLGDGGGLRVVDTPSGRVGALICWENYMPLARQALYADGVELYIAPTYDSGDGWLGTMQHIAREGRCWVICAGVALEKKDIPADNDMLLTIFADADDWINAGDSAVIAPGGEIVTGPLRNEKGILYADVDCNTVAIARRALDVAGHYGRPDIFALEVNRHPVTPISFK